MQGPENVHMHECKEWSDRDVDGIESSQFEDSPGNSHSYWVRERSTEHGHHSREDKLHEVVFDTAEKDL